MEKYLNKEGQLIIKYSFEDWKEGKYPMDKNLVGYQRFKNVQTGEIHLDYLPIEESQKIRQEQKKIFWDLVQNHFEYLVSVFNESDKDRLLKLEIEKWEYIFFPEIRIERKPPLGLDMSKFGGFDLLYEKQFIRNDIDFSLIKYNLYEKQFIGNDIDFSLIKYYNANPTLTGAILPASVYATAKYLDWLKEKLSEEQVNENLNQPQPTATKTEQETPTFTNNFDKITPIEIYNHFKVGLVEIGYLTELELNEYLKAAFELKTIPETLFKIKDAPNKAAIEAVFYTYYKNVAGKIHGRQKLYAALLGDYFEGYKTTTVSSNFSKSVY
jgi:hypothetical protein